MVTVTRQHLEALRGAIDDANNEAKTEYEVAGFNTASPTWFATHIARAKLAEERAARLVEVAAHILQEPDND